MNRLSKIAAAILIASPALAKDQPTNFSYEDVFNLEYASDPQFSNNGKSIYYVRNSINKMADNKRTNL
ncbi:hypothetical protein ACJJID_03715 [Microbulbifer sp. CnH-101-G]|uniref:hypothetical protein n=1 Tax=Microbulbifer sp. CnH-101-G TaxID=3243393 RepID=UPI0040392E76